MRFIGMDLAGCYFMLDGVRAGAAILWLDHAVSRRAENSPLIIDPGHLIYQDDLGQVACLRVKI
ncbi:MAG: hypothetical protein MK364_22020 [Pirellulales bacterium]|nr:hypothetical protein [Pirellulales bacterium]